jgi:hypothetical protein
VVDYNKHLVPIYLDGVRLWRLNPELEGVFRKANVYENHDLKYMYQTIDVRFVNIREISDEE